MNDKAEFSLMDHDSLERILAYFRNLESIMELKNKDSKKCIGGGAICRFEIEIKIREEWT